MSSWRELRLVSLIVVLNLCAAWLPDSSSKLTNDLGQILSVRFAGEDASPDHFVVLSQDENSIALGGRNRVYNLSTYDLAETKEVRIEWPSSDGHSQLCSLKGKTDDDCQNYVRVFERTAPGRLLICGTNSYKPLCRHYSFKGGRYFVEKEVEGIGLCPFNPEYNSTVVYSDGQLFSATVADFSGTDPLIYREPQRTEISDLKQLNAPNFVSSVPHGDYIFFFYRETAVEYINCGKIIYSRVARVCRKDKGGSHLYRDRWTSFLKARLNCSVPGEYPFYFDEIQSTSDIVKGSYGADDPEAIIYGVLTTPVNAIGGSAICAYRMRDILDVFEGQFKHQEGINSNWLPLPEDKVPTPRPGQCVEDSRVLPESNVNFVKMHSLMEEAVPALFGRPILIRVSLHYRFTAIAVDAQVASVNDEVFDVIYVGTDNGKVLKVVNLPSRNATKAVVISENTVFPNGTAVRQIRLSPTSGKVIVVGRDEVRLVDLNHCSTVQHCSGCLALQDPHCAWDTKEGSCVVRQTSVHWRNLLQDIPSGDGRKCRNAPKDTKDVSLDLEQATVKNIIGNNLDDEDDPEVNLIKSEAADNCENDNDIESCAVKQRLMIYTAETLHLVVFGATLAGLVLGFVAGYLFSRRFHHPMQYPDAPFIEQRNHLDRLSGHNGFLAPRANKAVNLEVNVVPNNPAPPKKDNLDVSKDLNIASDGTLQKIKKTYI